MYKIWLVLSVLGLLISCQAENAPTNRELDQLKNDFLTEIQTDSILNAEEIPDSIRTTYKKDSINGTYIPFNLYDSFVQIDSFFSDSTKLKIKQQTELEFLGHHHFGLGMWMRNNWGLWKGSRLWLYFYNKGVPHPDNISTLILTSYHRKVNDKQINFTDEVNEIVESIKEAKKLDNKIRSLGAQISSKYQIGDSITFEMPIDEDAKGTFLYGCPPSLISLPRTDSMLQIRGLVKNKRFIENDSVAAFTIEVLDLSRTDLEIMLNKKGIGDEIEFPAYDLYVTNTDTNSHIPNNK